MLKLALKNLAAGKIRLFLTTLLIVVGVGFVCSSFILRDGLKDVFANLAEEVVAGVDVGVSAFDPESNPIVEADLASLDGIAGIDRAELSITGEGQENRIQPIKPDGTTITLQGPPQLAFSWSDDSDVLSIIDGRAPAGPDEWVTDPMSLEEHGFVVGDRYDFITPSGRRQATLVGTYTFNGFIEGPTYMAMTIDTLRDYLEYGDRYDAIAVVSDGSVPVPELIVAIENALNTNSDFPRVLVQSQEELIADTTAEFNQVFDIIGGILLGFALLSLFVSVIIIIIIFAISIQQRTREIGLMRAIGATPSQILRSVMAESFIIGLLSSILGIAAGVVIALAIRAALNAAGLGIPSFGLVLKPLTIFLAFLVGIGVTMLAAIFPAIIASRVSPITAITGSSDKKERSNARYIGGAVVTAIGIALMSVGLFGGADTVTGVLVPLGFGAATTVIGILLLSPLVAGPLSNALGTPLQAILKTPGRLAKDNAARNPRRTGTIASVLMIGLTAVSMVFVLGSSFTAEFDRILNTSVQGDYLVTSDQADIPNEVVELIAQNDAFGNVTSVKYWGVSLANEPVVQDPSDNGVTNLTTSGQEIGYDTDLAAFEYDQIDGLFNLSVTQGQLIDMTSDTAALRDAVAEDLGLGIGDTITVYLNDGSAADLEVIAIFEEAQVAAGVLVTFDRFSDLSTQQTSDWVAAKRAEGVSVEAADAAFAEIGVDYPNLAFQSSAEFRQSFSDQISFITRIITILLALTILVALVGILATVALSVFERIREIGLLRAVGSTRRQVFTIVLWEGAIICAVGAILGAILGVGFGALILTAIPGEIISQIAIPWVSIIVMVLISSFLGLLAAFLPAMWASSRNVLQAISGG